MTNSDMKYLTTEGRLKTFKNFPVIKGAPLCIPKHLADAGFYSIATRKYPDSVKCFACGKQLSNWEEGDDPWQEHIRRGQDCPYVTLKSSKSSTYQDFLQLFISLQCGKIRSTSREIKRQLESHTESLKENAFEQ